MFSPQKMLIEKLVVLRLLCLLLIIHETKGNNLSKEEEMDFVKQYRLLQKPSIKMIQNEYGDVYDCVDFYKQPAFDHPQLKNHTFYPEMRPKSPPINGIPCDRTVMVLKEGGCPFGTVPIRRVSRDQFYDIYNFTQYYKKSNIQPTSGTHIALLQTNSDPSKVTYSGVGGAFNVYNLPIEQTQYTSGEFVIQNGDDRIKAGWMVNSKLYKDNYTHFFQYLDAGQSHCFNALCSGFVIVRKDIPIDNVLGTPSTRGEDPYFFSLHVYQDGESGNWWLNLCGVNVGFWPKQIFAKMSKSATYIGVGGEAYGPTNRPLPPMGSGYYPVDNNMELSAFFSNLVFIDGNHRKVDHLQVERYTNDPHYGINNAYSTGYFGHVILYGGIKK